MIRDAILGYLMLAGALMLALGWITGASWLIIHKRGRARALGWALLVVAVLLAPVVWW